MARIMAELPGVGRVYSGLSARKDLAKALHRSRQLAWGMTLSMREYLAARRVWCCDKTPCQQAYKRGKPNMRRLLLSVSTALVLLASALLSTANADLADRKAMTNAEARNAMNAAIAEATKNGWKMVIAVADDSGRLIMLERMDGAPTISVDIAPGKARTAALFGRSSALLEEAIKTRPAIGTAGHLLLQGGLPIMVNGLVIDSVGVSGATSQQDEQVAAAGIAAIKGADEPKKP
jgi:glc operon protein GlcG